MTAQAEDLIKSFECPVCFGYALPPIHQCDLGHLVCKGCKPKQATCPTCGGSFKSGTRAFALEEMSKALPFPCNFKEFGCKVSLPPAEKKQHEDSCEFGPYCCPYDPRSCMWKGSLEQALEHLLEAHDRFQRHPPTTEESVIRKTIGANTPGNWNWRFMQQCFGYTFLHYLARSEEMTGDQEVKFRASARLIGTRDQAEQFGYRIEAESENGRRLIWESTPRSMCEIVSWASPVIDKSDCLLMDYDVAKNFINDDILKLRVTVFKKAATAAIKQEPEEPTEHEAESCVQD